MVKNRVIRFFEKKSGCIGKPDFQEKTGFLNSRSFKITDFYEKKTVFIKKTGFYEENRFMF